MKQFWIVLIAIGSFYISQAQQLNGADLPAMIDLVDEHLNLNDYQKKELTLIFKDAIQEFEKIQTLEKTDVEKLSLMTQSQKATRNRLEVVLDNNQYQTYKALLDGSTKTLTAGTPVITETYESSSNTNANVIIDGSAASIADRLGFSGNEKSQFIAAYDKQEMEIQNVKNAGTITTASGIDLLTSILVTDFKIIDLGGRSTYEEYFQLRSSGQLNPNGSNSSGQDVDISQVYQLYDLKSALDLSDQQTGTFIRLIIGGEAEKGMIRKQYSGEQRAKKLKELETKSLQSLQQLLTPEQLQKLGQILGG
ncbi:MAG: hypothetical protein R2753_17985 [Chitinophagales bacterium]